MIWILVILTAGSLESPKRVGTYPSQALCEKAAAQLVDPDNGGYLCAKVTYVKK